MMQPKKQRGMTMIELMVTLAISTVILTGVINVYVNSLSQAKLSTNMAAMQESGRFALELLSRDIRMAGYTGCRNYDAATPHADDPVYVLYQRAIDSNAMFGIIGEEWSDTGYASNNLTPMVTTATVPIGTDSGSWTTSGGAELASNYPEAIGNSDLVQVWTSAEVAVDFTSFTPAPTQLAVNVEQGHGLEVGDVMMFANCTYIVIAQICEVADERVTARQGSASNCNNDFNVAPRDLGELAAIGVGGERQGYETYSFRDATYFVGKRDGGELTPPSLFRATNGVSREMVEGVENMQILYGVDMQHEPGDLRTPDQYVPAHLVGNRWSDVVAVRVSILMRSFEKGSGSDSYSFNFNGTPFTSTDGYLRQSYSTTIALRNRNVGDITNLYTSTP